MDLKKIAPLAGVAVLSLSLLAGCGGSSGSSGFGKPSQPVAWKSWNARLALWRRVASKASVQEGPGKCSRKMSVVEMMSVNAL